MALRILETRSAPQFRQTGVVCRCAMFSDMLRQQASGPEFLGITQILRFLTCQRNHPRTRFGRHRRAAATPRQIRQRLSHAQFQGLTYASFDTWAVRTQGPGDLRNRVPGVVAQQNRSPLHTAGRLALDCESAVTISTSRSLSINWARRLTKGKRQASL